MAGIAYYEILPCCSSSGTALDYFILPVGQVVTTTTTGVYNGTLVTINGITFTPGACYTIVPVGTIKIPPYPTAPSVLDYTPVTDCAAEPCLFKYYTLYGCSGVKNIQTDTDLSDYANSFVSLVGETDCFFVVPETSANCNPGGLVPVVVNTEVTCELQVLLKYVLLFLLLLQEVPVLFITTDFVQEMNVLKYVMNLLTVKLEKF